MDRFQTASSSTVRTCSLCAFSRAPTQHFRPRTYTNEPDCATCGCNAAEWPQRVTNWIREDRTATSLNLCGAGFRLGDEHTVELAASLAYNSTLTRLDLQGMAWTSALQCCACFDR